MTQPTSKVALEVNLDDDNDSMGQQTNIEPLQSLSLAGSNEMGEMASFVYREPNSSQSVSFKRDFILLCCFIHFVVL